MRKNAHSTRSFTAFVVTWSFLLLTVTGIVLYIVPHGRVGNWTFWSLAGLGKDGWADIHILFGAVFIVSGVLHLYFNWKPFKKYLAERVRGHLKPKLELVTSLLFTLLLTLGALFAAPPVSWLFDLNHWAKSAWSQGPGQEPPYARAESTSLPVLAHRLGFDLDEALTALRAAGIAVDQPNTNLAALARANHSTPAALFALIPQDASAPKMARGVAPDGAAPASAPATTDPLAIEERLAGTGVGKKTLAAFAEQEGLTATLAMARLAALGMEARGDDTIKQIADRHGIEPLDIAKAILVSGDESTH